MLKDGAQDTNWTGVRGGLRNLLRLEGAILFVACTIAYFTWSEAPWWLFAVLFLAPDLSFVAFVAGRRTGAVVYNAAHTTLGPLGLALFALASGQQAAIAVALIWGAHIGIDRAVGYGLRYPASFEHTHLGPVGALKKDLASG